MLAEPAIVQDVAEDYWRNRRSARNNAEQEDLGSMHWAAAVPATDGEKPSIRMPTRNWQRGIFTGIARVGNPALDERYRVDEPPPPNLEHHRRYLVPTGRFASDPRYGGFEPESLLGVAVACDLDDPEAVLKGIECTYRFGMDAESLGGTIAWAMESAERKLLAAAGIHDAPAFGDAEAFLELAELIAVRRGFGDILAEGSERAAAHVGHGSELGAMVSRGIELSGHEPRTKPGWALANASGPIGPDFLAVEHDWDFSPAVSGSGVECAIEKSRAIGILERLPEADHGPTKVRQVVRLQQWWSGALESLLFDYRAVAPVRYMPPDRVVQLVAGATGWDFSLHELMLIGERRITMLQEFNRRHGLSVEDERFPDRIHDEAIPDGPATGTMLPLDALRQMQATYYAMHGWDEEGLPHPWRLHELELAWMLDLRAAGLD